MSDPTMPPNAGLPVNAPPPLQQQQMAQATHVGVNNNYQVHHIMQQQARSQYERELAQQAQKEGYSASNFRWYLQVNDDGTNEWKVNYQVSRPQDKVASSDRQDVIVKSEAEMKAAHEAELMEKARKDGYNAVDFVWTQQTNDLGEAEWLVNYTLTPTAEKAQQMEADMKASYEAELTEQVKAEGYHATDFTWTQQTKDDGTTEWLINYNATPIPKSLEDFNKAYESNYGYSEELQQVFNRLTDADRQAAIDNLMGSDYDAAYFLDLNWRAAMGYNTRTPATWDSPETTAWYQEGVARSAAASMQRQAQLDSLSPDAKMIAKITGQDPLQVQAQQESKLLATAGYAIGAGVSSATVAAQNESILRAVEAHNADIAAGGKGNPNITAEGIAALWDFQAAQMKGALEGEIARDYAAQGKTVTGVSWKQTDEGLVPEVDWDYSQSYTQAFSSSMAKSGINYMIMMNPAYVASANLGRTDDAKWVYQPLNEREMKVFTASSAVLGAVVAAPILPALAGVAPALSLGYAGASAVAAGKAAVIGIGITQGFSIAESMYTHGVSLDSVKAGVITDPVDLVIAGSTGVIFAAGAGLAVKGVQTVAPKIAESIFFVAKGGSYVNGLEVGSANAFRVAAQSKALTSAIVTSLHGQAAISAGVGGVAGGVLGGFGYDDEGSLVWSFDKGSALLGAALGGGMVYGSYALSQGSLAFRSWLGSRGQGSTYPALPSEPTTSYSNTGVYDVAVYQTKPIPTLGNRTVRVIGAHTELGIGAKTKTGQIVTAQSIIKDIGTQNYATHLTSSAAMPTRAGKSVALVGALGGANIVRTALQEFPFYMAPGTNPSTATKTSTSKVNEPTTLESQIVQPKSNTQTVKKVEDLTVQPKTDTGSVNIYGAYGGIGAEAENAPINWNAGPLKAYVVDAKIDNVLPKAGENFVEHQSRFMDTSGAVSMPPENVAHPGTASDFPYAPDWMDMGNLLNKERQLVAPTRYDLWGLESEGTTLTAGEKVGTVVVVQEAPSWWRELVGDIPFIGGVLESLGKKRIPIELFDAELKPKGEPLSDTELAERAEKRMETVRTPRLRQRGAAIVETSRGVLVLSEGGEYYLPGGEVELGESAASAVLRELREETGIRRPAAQALFEYTGEVKADRHSIRPFRDVNRVFRVTDETFFGISRQVARPMGEITSVRYVREGGDWSGLDADTRAILRRYFDMRRQPANNRSARTLRSAVPVSSEYLEPLMSANRTARSRSVVSQVEISERYYRESMGRRVDTPFLEYGLRSGLHAAVYSRSRTSTPRRYRTGSVGVKYSRVQNVSLENSEIEEPLSRIPPSSPSSPPVSTPEYSLPSTPASPPRSAPASPPSSTPRSTPSSTPQSTPNSTPNSNPYSYPENSVLTYPLRYPNAYQPVRPKRKRKITQQGAKLAEWEFAMVAPGEAFKRLKEGLF